MFFGSIICMYYPLYSHKIIIYFLKIVNNYHQIFL
ncbi:transcriptional regulator, XRE family, partial [Campylobacter jejuni]|nr:transcriptional regulator, XRE family [Campylobacter jejuni]